MVLIYFECCYIKRWLSLLFEVLSFIRIGSAKSGILRWVLRLKRWVSVSFLMLKTHLFYFLFCYGACQTGARVAGVKASATKNPLPAAADPHHQLHITTTPKYAPLPPNTSQFFVSIFLNLSSQYFRLHLIWNCSMKTSKIMIIRIFGYVINNILLYT